MSILNQKNKFIEDSNKTQKVIEKSDTNKKINEKLIEQIDVKLNL